MGCSREARNRAVAKWRAKNPAAHRVITKRNYDKHAEWKRMLTILRKHGLTLDQYHSLLENQDFSCFLCGVYAPLQVDHCHTTNRVRRMLCRQCNSGLGQLREDPALLRAAAAYVERFRYGTE